MFTFSGKDRKASCQFDENATKRPHVNCSCVRNAKDDFWCSVKSWLYVSVNALVGKAGWAKVNNLDTWLVWRFKQNVLWLQIAVDHILFAEILKSLKDLDCKSTNEREWDTLEVVVFDEFVQINREKLERNNQVLAELAAVLNLDYVICIIRILVLQVLKNL